MVPLLEISNHLLHVIVVVVSQSVQSLSRVWLFATPWIATRQASLSITNSRSSLKLSSSSRGSTSDGSTGSFPGGTAVKNPPANVGDARECRFYPWIKKIAQSRKWSPNPVSLFGKSLDRGDWQATVHGVKKSRTQLSHWAGSPSITGQKKQYPVMTRGMGTSSDSLELWPETGKALTYWHSRDLGMTLFLMSLFLSA